MKERSKVCSKCKNFERYYTEGVKQFNQAKCGYCYKKKENVSNKESCENFVIRPRRKKNRYMLRVCLNRLLTEITDIRKVIEAESNESE